MTRKKRLALFKKYAPRERPVQALIHCHHCKSDVIADCKTSGPHLKAICPTCNKYIKFVSKRELL